MKPINTGHLSSIRPKYQDKLEELTRRALSIVERGLESESEYLRQQMAVQFLQISIFAALDKPMPAEPDALDAEEITVKETNE